MIARPAVVTGSGSASWRSAPDEWLPLSAATHAQLCEAARFAISPDGHADDARLQAAFKLLRAEAPVLWVDTPGMRPFWLLSRYGDISAVERRGAPFAAATRTFLTSRMTEERLERLLGQPYVLRGLLQMDDPEHAAYRAVAQPYLTPAALAEMEPWLETWADHIVSRIAGRTDAFDFTKEIAVPFSIRGIMRLLGLPEADDDLVLKLSWGLVGPEDPVRRLADHPTTAICRAGLGFQAYFDPVAADRRACPRHDLSSVIATAQVQGESMPDYERFSYYAMIATGGHDTIAFCLSGGMHALIEHPDQLARLRADPDLIDTAIEEMLRWTTPGRHIVRTATQDIELGGQTIRAGEAVALFFNSANRDETVFANADQFRIDRRPNPHLAFGLGRHHCIGAHLARLEMRALLKTLLPRLKSVELAAPPRRTCSTMVSGISSLPIRCAWRAPDL
ncbi:MAG TPA: cytochrome P450 [Bradyrhizobium sp.]|uniref:cytochrome P450 n=1 Tax=Bradyrhizobium sp. TaxID=376 RepID=UPI002C4395D9|nr:cytochrome P450 [Bradyrhizobium sp.]HTA99277.1 cytochrome P450 [Bradyrhizobium sp.]